MANVNRIEKRMKKLFRIDHTARCMAVALADMSEKERVNLALDLVEGVDLERCMPEKPTTPDREEAVKAKKPEKSWAL